MHRSASRLVKALLLATLLVMLSASAAPTRTDTPATVTGLSRMHRREIVDVEDGDIEEEEGLFDEDDREAGGESDVPEDTSNGDDETLQTNPEAKAEEMPQDQAEETSAAPPLLPQPTAAALHERPDPQPKSNDVVTAWMRPDRIKFDGQQAPFVVPDGKDVTWYKIGGQAGEATTIAAQQIKEITDYKGSLVTATIGDVMIFQDGAIAEAIGSVMPNGKRGELYNIIACNVQTEKGKCIMVDYDGRDVKETLSKIITGSSSTVPVTDPSQAPAALRQWASNVMVLNVATVTAKARSRQKRSQGGLRF